MMKDKKYFTGSYKRAAAAALTSALLLTPLASLAESAMIQGGALNLREQPSKNATVLGQYPSGTWVEVLEAGIDWSRVSVDGKEGYMMSKYLTGGSSGSSSTMYVRTNTRGLNLRKEPNDTSAIITSYPKGTKVTVLARGTKWQGQHRRQRRLYVRAVPVLLACRRRRFRLRRGGRTRSGPVS